MDAPLLWAVALAGVTGLSIPLGAALARWDWMRHALSERQHHAISAFGGGALLAAVALVLVPDGAEVLRPWTAVALFAAGGTTFFLLDRALARRGGAAAMMVAMLLDYLPEAAALGAVLTETPGTAAVLAMMIFLQNVPEGFGAFREIEERERAPSPGAVLSLFAALAALGPVCAAAGMLVLGGAPHLLGAIMLFAAGGILYLVFEDVAPASRIAGDPAPPLGAVAGFALGLAGHLVAA